MKDQARVLNNRIFLVRILFVFLVLACTRTFAQQSSIIPNRTVIGTVQNAANDRILEGVHIVNLNQVLGAVSDEKGMFSIQSKRNDTLYFSYIGFKALKVRVSGDLLKFGTIKVKMTELGIALEEVVVAAVQLTGYLEIDAKNIPIYDHKRFKIPGLPSSGYEAGSRSPSGVQNALRAIMDPANFLYNMFGKNGGQLKKLRQMKRDDKIRNLLETKFDRQTLSALLQLEEMDIDEILRRCNYSTDFIEYANDLQILDAMSNCYEEYKVLKRSQR